MQYKIKELREKARLSQTALAEKSGVSRATISIIESGKASDIKIETLSRIAGALGGNISYLFLF